MMSIYDINYFLHNMNSDFFYEKKTVTIDLRITLRLI